jgi:hypothetical protein
MPPIQILDPTVMPNEAAGTDVQQLHSLTGKVLGLRVDWPNYEHFCNRLDELIRSRIEIGDIEHFYPPKLRSATSNSQTVVTDFAERIDAAVVGLAA